MKQLIFNFVHQLSEKFEFIDTVLVSNKISLHQQDAVLNPL